MCKYIFGDGSSAIEQVMFMFKSSHKNCADNGRNKPRCWAVGNCDLYWVCCCLFLGEGVELTIFSKMLELY